MYRKFTHEDGRQCIRYYEMEDNIFATMHKCRKLFLIESITATAAATLQINICDSIHGVETIVTKFDRTDEKNRKFDCLIRFVE